MLRTIGLVTGSIFLVVACGGSVGAVGSSTSTGTGNGAGAATTGLNLRVLVPPTALTYASPASGTVGAAR
jgi:hypothetical protein